MKKLNASAIVSCLGCVASIVALILYSSNVSGEGFYKGMTVPNMYLLLIGAAVCFALVFAVNFFLEKSNKVVQVVSGLLQIAGPVLLAVALMQLVAGRVDGLGYIYFSNAEVAAEVQTPENLGSAQTAIASLVSVGVAAVAGCVGAFFSAGKKEA